MNQELSIIVPASGEQERSAVACAPSPVFVSTGNWMGGYLPLGYIPQPFFFKVLGCSLIKLLRVTLNL